MRPLAMLAAALLASSVQAQVFKWVDENGKTHYGEKPPPGVKATEIGVPASPASSSAPETSQQWKEKEIEFRQRSQEREQKEKAAQREGLERKQRCSYARSRLSLYGSPGSIYEQDDQGKRTYLKEEDRGRVIASWQKEVDKHCGS